MHRSPQAGYSLQQSHAGSCSVFGSSPRAEEVEDRNGPAAYLVRPDQITRAQRARPGRASIFLPVFLPRAPFPCGGDMAAAGDLSDDEKRAMRGSKFAPLPPPPSTSRPQPRYRVAPFSVTCVQIHR